MKVLYPKLNILNIRWDGRNNTKEPCSCISTVISSKSEWLAKKQRKQHEGYY